MSYFNPDWLQALVEYLDVEGAAEWLSRPLSALDERSPLEAVGDGDQAKVARMVLKMIEAEADFSE